jgi:hypothetical protein
MKVSVGEVSPVSALDLARVEHFFGCALGEELLLFYNEFNGARLSLNELSGELCSAVGVNAFIPIDKVIGVIERFPFAKNFLPIAWAEGGNYIVINLLDGQIYFVNHELEEGYFKVASNVGDFLDKLLPSKPLTALPEGVTVGDVWIDPDFLKRVKSGEFD